MLEMIGELEDKPAPGAVPVMQQLEAWTAIL